MYFWFLGLGLGLGLGLEARHNTLHHVLALLVTIALACICWCCWKRNRSIHRHRHRRDLLLLQGPLPVSSAISSAVSNSPSPPLPPPPPPPRIVLPPLPFRHFRSPTPTVSSTVSPVSDACVDQDLLIKNSECPICLYAFETDVLLIVLPSCGHAYHPSCIHGWIQSHTDCPICRAQIPHIS